MRHRKSGRKLKRTASHRKATLISTLNFAIHETFQKHGIETPFPQRDIRIRSGATGA